MGEHLEFWFKNKNVRKLCEKRNEAEKKLGADCARKLRARLSDIEAVTRVSELIAGNPHPLKGDRLEEFALNLAGGCRLVFVPGNEPVPVKDDGGIDWARVTEVCIEYIGDYHD